MQATATTTVIAGNVLRGALRDKSDIYSYDKAYRDAFVDDLPAPSTGVPAFEAAVALLLGADLLSDKRTGFSLTAHALSSVDDLIASNGGWVEWYLQYGQYAVDYEEDEEEEDNSEVTASQLARVGSTGEIEAKGIVNEDDLPPRDAPASVKERTIADALVARATGYPSRWSLPADYIVPRKGLVDAVSTPFLALVIGLLAIIAVPIGIIGGLLFIPLYAAAYAVRRARGRI